MPPLNRKKNKLGGEKEGKMEGGRKGAKASRRKETGRKDKYGIETNSKRQILNSL